MDAQKFNELLGITGGKKDIKEIAEKYYDSVKAHITWRFKGLVDPDDAVQDIFLKMMEYEFKYYVDYPATWIYRFADNCVIDALRKMRPTEELPETVRVVHFELEDTVVRKCLEELRSGNNEFVQAEKTIKKALCDLHMRSVDYFMEHFVPAFSLTLDELEGL